MGSFYKPLSFVVPDPPFFLHAPISFLGWRWIHIFITVLLDSLDYRERGSPSRNVTMKEVWFISFKVTSIWPISKSCSVL